MISALRVSEAEAAFNGDLLWAPVDSVDKAEEICKLFVGWVKLAAKVPAELGPAQGESVPRGTAVRAGPARAAARASSRDIAHDGHSLRTMFHVEH